MMRELWTTVDDYLEERLLAPDAALTDALVANAAGGLPAIDVSPPQGKLLTLLAQMQGARAILEVGTLGGYSTICLARALPRDGRLVTLELDPRHAQVARGNLERAGLAPLVDLRVGPALAALPQLVEEGAGPFDLVFIDADKQSSAEYVTWALELTRPGSVIMVDNVIRAGAVADSRSGDASVQGSRRLLDLLAAEPRLSSTALQTVGGKGYDGFTVSLVVAPPA